MQSEDKLRAMLSDLGRCTLRGIRKCPKCGTKNGIRGLSCKNNLCDVVFKEAGERRKRCMEVAKLDTGLSTQVFSVRVRDVGPDYRGFVQLPVERPNVGDAESTYLSQMSAVCFVESCQRLFNTNILKCHERQAMSVTTCQHIYSAMRCCADAQVLPVDNEILKSINISNEMKQAILQLAYETPGPLVQRVSKNVMAVKCKVTTEHPVGFVHVLFFPSAKSKENNFSCSCTPKNLFVSSEDESVRNCVHFYSCIAAFASNEKCMEEFSSFIMKEKAPETFILEINSEEQNPFVALLEDDIGQEGVECVLQKDMMLTDISQDFDRLSTVVVSDITNDLESGLDQQTLQSVITTSEEVIVEKEKPSKVQKRKRVTTSKNKNDSGKKFVKKDVRKQLQISDEAADENKVQFTFIEWLASVTERINQTMHFQFDGKPEPLIFHAPHAFFECLLERLMAPSVLLRRKRLPNHVTSFTRKDAPPLGTFYTYTWHISNILHAKAIFDTPLMLLNVKRGFILKPDGTYEDAEPYDIHEGAAKREGEASIRPVDLKTYLKIGKTKPDQETPSLLSIDWTPNLLPISKIGELKITFEFGHSPKIC